MKYFFLALMATILVSSGGHSQEQSVKILSITNRQQLLVEVEQHGRAVRLACLQAPRFLQEPWFELRSRDVYGHLVGRLFVNGKDLGAHLYGRGA